MFVFHKACITRHTIVSPVEESLNSNGVPMTLIEKGCVVQINSRAITDGNKIALKYIKWGMAHLICSDTHNMDERSPNMKDGMKVIERKFGEDYVSWFNKNAVNVFKGNYVDLTVPKKPKKILGIWM